MGAMTVFSYRLFVVSGLLAAPLLSDELKLINHQPTTAMESIANQKKSLKAILEEKKNERRVLLLYGRDDSQHLLIEQQEALHPLDVADQLAQRDMDVIVLVASLLQEPDRWFLMHDEDFKLVLAEDFQGWLIGKDGGVKHTFKKPVSPEELFKLVDSMPMRQQEMKKQD